jgi:hypothetical protein
MSREYEARSRERGKKYKPKSTLSNDNNIKIFTVADIEKYHKGQLSPKEMHELEKAALDDPFLADALEGYATPGINISEDIIELRRRLSENTERTKVIPIHTAGRSQFPWLRAAIAIILVAGAGLLAYEFLYKGPIDRPVAALTTKNNKTVKDTLSRSSKNDDISGTTNTFSDSQHQYYNFQVSGKKETADQKDNRPASAGSSSDTSKLSFELTTTSAPPVSPSVNNQIEKREEVKAGSPLASEYKKADDRAKQAQRSAEPTDDIALNKSRVRADTVRIAGFYAKDKAASDNYGSFGATANAKSDALYRKPNYFRGRVTDNANNALPFANITNTKDNVGTYSDAQGYFTLVSPDSVMNVQVKSVGFENNNVQLRNYVADNRILMQEDKSVAMDTIDKVKRNISSRRKNTMVLEEPEPEDGWDSYGSYVANNVNVPENFEKRKTGGIDENSVEVSFEVTRDGNPVNFKVEKSLCDQCDKEAVRLIKEGPKWKRKNRKSKKTTISIPFR